MDFADIFDKHDRMVLWFSGGKDSTALLHMLQPWRHRVCVIHNALEPDQAWPGMRQHVEKCLDDWGFLRSIFTTPFISFDDYTKTFGWPVEIVPSDRDGSISPPSPYRRSALTMSSWWHCTILRQLQPLVVATNAYRADAVLTGSRSEDAPAFAWMGEVATDDIQPWVRYNPLCEWSSHDVYTYIEDRKIELPPHYDYKQYRDDYEWVDCMSCTWQTKHWKVMKTYYPEEFEKRWPQARLVFDALRRDTQNFSEALKELPK